MFNRDMSLPKFFLIEEEEVSGVDGAVWEDETDDGVGPSVFWSGVVEEVEEVEEVDEVVEMVGSLLRAERLNGLYGAFESLPSFSFVVMLMLRDWIYRSRRKGEC